MFTKEWFVIHTLTGQETNVRDRIKSRLKLEEMEDYIDEVIIPTEKVSEVKKGVRITTTRKFFPGYVLAHMALYGEERRVLEKSWHFIRETTGVIGFIGGGTAGTPATGRGRRRTQPGCREEGEGAAEDHFRTR